MCPSIPHRKALSTEQAFPGQLPSTGEGDGTAVDHSGFAETERLQRTTAEQRGQADPERGQAG